MVFQALKETPFQEVKVVILGQDPYHTPGMATGLSFSVPEDTIKIPPSLRNIFEEMEDDIGFKDPAPNPDLTRWARQGVLLLNTSLTVREYQAASHANIGWSQFTARVLQEIMEGIKPTVFILWGNHAQHTIDSQVECDWNTHLAIRSAHPSPLSAHKGFFGSKPFSRTNKFLVDAGIEPIDWRV